MNQNLPRRHSVPDELPLKSKAVAGPRESTEKELHETQKVNRSILNSLSTPITVLSEDGTILEVNQAWKRLAQENEASVDTRQGVGMNYIEVCGTVVGPSGDYVEKCLSGFKSVLDGRAAAFDMEYPFPSRTEPGWYLLRAVPLRGAEKGLVVSHINISEHKRAEEELRSAFQEIDRLKEELQNENIYLKEELKLHHSFDEIVGQSRALNYVLVRLQKVAPTDTTVMIQGETGTGKELIARAIHNLSLRKQKPLVTVNCATLPPNLIESELFGHKKGAFTGANEDRVGRFEMAHNGTIFLDEIGELPLDLQAKLLGVLQDGVFERLGSSKTIKVDVRVIAATNRILAADVRNGRFRQDLYYRLSVFPITMPPLRARKSDIPLLVHFFAQRFAKKLGKKIESVSRKTMDALQNYLWPGNIRELENVIERAVVISHDSKLKVELPKHSDMILDDHKTLEEIERRSIIAALEQSQWKINGDYGAANMLGLHPSTLRSRMKKLGIRRPESLIR